MEYIPLHTMTGYSFLSSSIKIDNVIANSIKNKLSYVAVSDFGVASSYPSFCHLANKNNLKPIYGLTLNIKTNQGEFYIAVYIKNEKGYESLCQLIYHKEEIDSSLIEKYKEGLILVIPTLSNKIVKDALINEQISLLEKIFFKLQSGFEDVYIGMEKYTNEDEIVLSKARDFAQSHSYKSIAFPKNLYVRKQDAINLEILSCIKNDQKSDLNELSGPFFFLSTNVASSIYTNEEILNTEELCKSIDFNFSIKRGKLLSYPLNGDKKQIIYDGCIQRLSKKINPLPEKYVERLKYELNIISQMGYLDYFLIVSEYVKYAKSNSIPVGPGRGSACGSLVSYALGITEIDPLKYGLIFERFLNPERVTMPDIDIDIADVLRDDVINHIRLKYGKNRMSDIITFQTIGAKQALRDIGRVYSEEFKQADINMLCSFFPDSKTTLEDGEKNSPELQKLLSSAYLNKIFTLAKKIEGLPRQSSIHPAGIILNNDDLSYSLPLNRDGDKIICQFESIYLEELGYLKMDILGLRTLSIIDKMEKRIKKNNDKFNIHKIPLNDFKTFNILNAGLTKGIFQIESEGMTSSIMKVRIDRFENISDMIALYRPGPIKQIPDFSKRKNFGYNVTYIHESLKNILSSTYGIIIYQEQIMEICQKCASFTFAQADLFRRAISKKNDELLKIMKSNFIQGCEKNNISTQISEKIFELIFNFANYGFNKSHSIAYSKLLYEMAYIKANYPLEYYSTLLDFEILNDSVYYSYKKELDYFAIKVVLPNINYSTLDFEISNNDLILPLTKIKNLPLNISLSIIQERLNGPFIDFSDFMNRMFKYELQLQHYVTLINSGSLDVFNHTRSSLLQVLPTYLQYASYFGTTSGNGLLDNSQMENMKITITPIEDIEDEKDEKQYEALGFRLGNTKLSKYISEIENHNCKPISKSKNCGGTITLAAIIGKIKITQTKKDKLRMATFVAFDETDQIRCVMFSDVFLRDGLYLKENQCVFIEGYFKNDNRDQTSFIINSLVPIGGK